MLHKRIGRDRPSARLSIWRAAGLILALATMLLAGCSKSDVKLDPNKVNVVTSFYPLYDFAMKIGGAHVNVVNLVPPGVEPHEWSPKSGDLRQLVKSQLFVYLGAGLEAWVDSFMNTVPKDSKLVTVKASQGVDLLDQGSTVDPHIWLSPVKAKRMAENIRNGLIQADPGHKEEYEANYAKLASRFDALDAKYRQALSHVSNKEIVVSHEAFGYLCREYGLQQMAIMGLSPDAEPRAQDMKKIIDFVKQNHVKTIFFEELVSDKLAKTLASDAGVGTAMLNPLEGLKKEDLQAGEDYFSVMEKNLETLTEALR